MRYLLPCSITAIVAACSYGSYDGSYDGGLQGADGGTDAAGGTVVLVRSVDTTRQETIVAEDGVLELTFAAGAFASPTTVTIARLEERTVDNLIVPVYSVIASAPLLRPMQVIFRGNNPNGGDTSRRLLVAQRRPDGSFAPTTITGTGFGGGGGGNSFWGLTKELGVFSLVFETLQPSDGFYDVSSSSCIGKCCASNGMGGTQANGILTSTGVGCQSEPNVACFADACPDFAAVVARATDLAKNNPPVSVQCRPFAALGVQNCPGPGCQNYDGNCENNGPCCVSSTGGRCVANGGAPSCSGIAIRCDLTTACPGGTKCCAFETDTYCTATCPNARTICDDDSKCAGTTCQPAPKCPFKTCGAPPVACQ